MFSSTEYWDSRYYPSLAAGLFSRLFMPTFFSLSFRFVPCGKSNWLLFVSYRYNVAIRWVLFTIADNCGQRVAADHRAFSSQMLIPRQRMQLDRHSQWTAGNYYHISSTRILHLFFLNFGACFFALFQKYHYNVMMCWHCKDVIGNLHVKILYASFCCFLRPIPIVIVTSVFKTAVFLYNYL